MNGLHLIPILVAKFCASKWYWPVSLGATLYIATKLAAVDDKRNFAARGRLAARKKQEQDKLNRWTQLRGAQSTVEEQAKEENERWR